MAAQDQIEIINNGTAMLRLNFYHTGSIILGVGEHCSIDARDANRVKTIVQSFPGVQTMSTSDTSPLKARLAETTCNLDLARTHQAQMKKDFEALRQTIQDSNNQVSLLQKSIKGIEAELAIEEKKNAAERADKVLAAAEAFDEKQKENARVAYTARQKAKSEAVEAAKAAVAS